jgi:hypothetical protein
MPSHDEYLGFAAQCQTMAERTKQESEKRQWLRLAESWLRMAHDYAEPFLSPRPSPAAQTVLMQQQPQQQQQQGKKLDE